MRRFLRRQLQGMADPGDGDDLLHDLFLRSLRQGGAFCQVENARAWLFAVARNLVIDYQRRLRPYSELPEELPDDPIESAPVEDLAYRHAPRWGADGALPNDYRGLLVLASLSRRAARKFDRA